MFDTFGDWVIDNIEDTLKETVQLEGARSEMSEPSTVGTTPQALAKALNNFARANDFELMAVRVDTKRGNVSFICDSSELKREDNSTSRIVRVYDIDL